MAIASTPETKQQLMRETWQQWYERKLRLALILSHKFYFIWERYTVSRSCSNPKPGSNASAALAAKTKAIIQLDRIMTDHPRPYGEFDW